MLHRTFRQAIVRPICAARRRPWPPPRHLHVEPLVQAVASPAAEVAADHLEPLCGPLMKQFLTVAPGVAVQAVFLAPLQAVKQFHESGTTADVSVAPYAAMFSNGALWMTYGWLLGVPAIALPNVSAVVLGAVWCGAFWRYRSPHATTAPYFGAAATSVVFAGGAAATLPAADAASLIGSVGCAASVAMFSGPLASIRAVLRDRSAAALPPAFTVISVVNTTVWTSYGFLVIHDPFIYGPNALGLASSLTQLGLIARFGTAPPRAPRAKDSWPRTE